MFLDHEKPLHTCKEQSCAGCDVGNAINCHFQMSQLAKFYAFCLPVMILGAIGLIRHSWWAFALWAVLFVTYFSLVEIRVMCSHCPHYAEQGQRYLQCWANYGAPKLWKYRPVPMSVGENIVFFAGLFVVCFFPVVFMILRADYLILALFAAALAVGSFMLRHFLCVKCMNFACPFNRTDRETRQKFFAHNPAIAKGWRDSGYRKF